MKKTKQKEKIQSELDSNLADKQLVNELDFSDLDWPSAQGGGSNFKTHNLRTVDDNTLAFKQTIEMRIFSWVFFLVGMGFIYVSRAVGGGAIFLGLFGSVFALVGLQMIGFGSRSLVFDGYNKVYRQGDTWLSLFYKRGKDTYTDFDDIIAVQFLRKYVSSDDSSYSSYEINLVLHDKTRVNVVDHGNGSAARKDAIYLAEFLGVPFLEKESE